MSIGPVSPLIDAAGAPLAQTTGASIARAKHDAAAHARQVESDRRSLAAARAGEPAGEKSVTDDSQADGRRDWEGSPPAEETPATQVVNPPADAQAADGAVGRGIDLTA